MRSVVKNDVCNERISDLFKGKPASIFIAQVCTLKSECDEK
jgi:hypothetical protein